jgi:hypothetical protein
MKKFVAIFGLPASAIQEWMATVDEASRKEQTEKLMGEWKAWNEAHKESIVDAGLPLGKTKRVNKDGVTDVKNDLNWMMIVQADSHEAAAQLFVGHPHLVTIPSSYVEVMDSSRPGM